MQALFLVHTPCKKEEYDRLKGESLLHTQENLLRKDSYTVARDCLVMEKSAQKSGPEHSYCHNTDENSEILF